MKTWTIQVPENKTKQVKAMLQELGVVVETDPLDLALEINKSIKPAEEITMDEIVEEIRAYREGR